MNTLLRKILIATLVATPLFISHAALGIDQTTDYFRIYGTGTPMLWLDETSAGKSDWLLVNDHTILESFSIRWDDAGSQQTPFRIETGSADNLLYLDNNERIGINKANPLETLEIATAQPGIRLDDISAGAGMVDIEMSLNRFTIQGNSEQAFINAETTAPNNSIYIDSTGHIGLGVANPSRDLVVGGSGDVYLENGASDWLIYTSSSGLNFWNMDSAPTSPLYLGTNAPTYSLVVEPNTGDVGVGTATPNFDLHVFGDGGGSVEQVLRLQSSVPPQMTFLNSASSGTGLWYFAMTSDDQFKVSYDGTGKVEAKFFQNGNLQIAGTLIAGTLSASTLNQNSDRDSKTDIVEVDNKTVLDAVLGMPVSTWEYKADKGVKHLGPMAQDFHAAFGLGSSPKSISTIDSGGVALAAIKGLNQVVQEKDARISAQKQEIDSLKKGNQELSERLTRLEAQQERISQLEELLRGLTVKGDVAQR